MKKNFSTLLIGLLTLCLASCTTTIARFIDHFENIDDVVYPPAEKKDHKTIKSVDIQLDKYKPVQTRANKKRNFALALAISGGGYRSANLGLGVLLGLEKIKNKGLKENLLQEIDYISTVSGGGLPVGFYLTKLHNYYEHHTNINQFSLETEINNLLLNDSIRTNPLRADLTRYLYSTNERVGLRIEQILNDTLLWTNQGGLTEGDIFVPKGSNKAVQLPYWIINTTIYQNSAIFPFTPDELNDALITRYYHRNQYWYNYSNQPLGYKMPVSVGLMASMSVPIVLPATTFESRACTTTPCYLHLYDGGIADNLGINTALNLLIQDKRKIKILMVVDSGKDLIKSYSKFKKSPKGLPLTVHLASMTIDAYRKFIKSHINFISKKLLCSKKGNVIVIYLDLADYPATQEIKTKLKMSLRDQKTLLRIGQELVEKDKTLKIFLSQLSQGNVTIGQCG